MGTEVVDPTIILMPRTPAEPAPQEIYLAMDDGEPYTVNELHEHFAEKYDVTRWTIRDRLEGLVESGMVQKKKHSQQRVSYWIA